ncbi:MAG: lactate racemase domain-containing protein [Myxococcota bacterium]|mgnify:CR=1 FL=1
MPLHDLEQEVVIIDKDSAPRILHFGEDFLLEDLPVGTRVVYPRAPLAGLANVDAAIRHAITHPLGMEPLHALLTPGMRVTIAVDDISLPLPFMKAPDVRERVLRVVLQMLADYAVDDIHIIVATGLHRRMTASEVRHMVGDHIFEGYWPDRLYNHDGEDPDGIVHLGTTDAGEHVELNRRAVESDLIIYVNINLVPMDGGHKSVAVGLANYRTMLSHHNPTVLRQTASYMEPSRSHMHSVMDRMGRLTDEHLKVFHIETVLNNRMYGPQLDFLAKNEDHFSDLDWLKLDGMRFALKHMPKAAKRKLMHSVPAAYEVIAVNAGATEPVHAKTLARSFDQYSVPVDGQADIVITGIPYLSPYNVNSILNPILVQVMGLGYLYNMNRGTPVLKKGGTLILTHPCDDAFDPEHHPSYIELFNRLLPETRDAAVLHERYEQEFAHNPSYVDRYRFGNAYHGAHPFYMWYWGEGGRRDVGRIIAAGAENSRVTELLGWERADSLAEAIAMARSSAPTSPEITMLHHPPIFIADVH